MKQTLTTQESDFNKRIDKFISEKIDLSRSKIKALVDDGYVKIGDDIVKSCSVKIKDITDIAIIMPEVKECNIEPNSQIPLDIIYEDEYLMVINKQFGLTVHPGAGNYNETMVNALMHYAGDNLSGIGGFERPGIVHRLDKDTSGLIIVAKTDKAHAELSNQIAERSVKRVYTAFCWSVTKPHAGAISTNIDRNPKNRLKMRVSNNSGKLAITNYLVKKIYGNGIASKIECRLQTGRTHQIRVHMQHKKTPIIGDQLYGLKSQLNNPHLSDSLKELLRVFNRQALHSSSLAFSHPITGELIEKTCALPSDMQHLEIELELL